MLSLTPLGCRQLDKRASRAPKQWRRGSLIFPSDSTALLLSLLESNDIIRQITRVTAIVHDETNTKWKWAGHIARIKDNRWTIRSTAWQGVRSVGRPKRSWGDDIVWQQGAVWTRIAKDRRRWRTLAEGYVLQWKDTA